MYLLYPKIREEGIVTTYVFKMVTINRVGKFHHVGNM